MSRERLYCLFDRVANARAGAVVVHRADAPVVRMFHDLLAQEEQLKRHAGDYEMLCIGEITEDGAVFPLDRGPVVIATGAQWLAAQEISA